MAFLDKFSNPRLIETVIKDGYRVNEVYVLDKTPPAKNWAEMQGRIEREIDKRLEKEWHLDKEDLALLLEVLDEKETKEFCKGVVDQFKKVKPVDDSEKVQANAKKPSEKQIAFLRKLGFKGAAPKTMSEASRLIEQYKQKI